MPEINFRHPSWKPPQRGAMAPPRPMPELPPKREIAPDARITAPSPGLGDAGNTVDGDPLGPVSDFTAADAITDTLPVAGEPVDPE